MLKVDNFIFRLVVKKALQSRQELNGGPFTMAENKKKNGNKIKKQVDKKKKHKTKEELREEVVKLSKKLGRVRNWTIIVYPESAPKNWRDIIDSTHVTWVEGPIHDKDVNPDGTTKPAHWHVVLIFDGNKTMLQVWDSIATKVNSPFPQAIEGNVGGMIRYLIHLDNPEKHQYKEEDIKVHGAFDVQKYLHGNSADKRKVLIEILKFIDDNELKYFHQLQHYCIYHEKYDWLDVINYSNTMSIKATIQSQWQKARDEKLADNSEEGQLARTVEAKKELKQRVKALADKGKTRKEIADKFNISVRTVKRYVNDN